MSKAHFPLKLYEMLQYAADSELKLALSWTDDGQAFSIHQKDVFLEHIVPLFFKQTKFRSFVGPFYLSISHLYSLLLRNLNLKTT